LVSASSRKLAGLKIACPHPWRQSLLSRNGKEFTVSYRVPPSPSRLQNLENKPFSF
jgi:hypothetical protein